MNPLTDNLHNIDSNEYIQSINQLVDVLDTQKKLWIFTSNLYENFEDKVRFIESSQKKIVYGLFSNQPQIVDNFKKKLSNVIFESKYDIEKEIDKFNSFILDTFINEQYPTVQQIGASVKNAYQSAKSAVQKAVPYVQMAAIPGGGGIGGLAVNYIQEHGVEATFEEIRKILMSGAGTAVQIALAMTGGGAIANDIVWGIMTLYDGYQLLVNSNYNHIFYLVVDLICLATAGALGNTLFKSLGRLVASGAKSVEEAVVKLFQSEVGPYLKVYLPKLVEWSAIISSKLKEYASFLTKDFGISWVGRAVESISTFFKKMVTKLESLLVKGETATAKLATKFANVVGGSSFLKLFPGGLAKSLETLTAEESKKWIQQKVSKDVLAIIEKKVTEFKRESAEEILSFIDKNYGTQYSNYLKAYHSLKKLADFQGKISKGVENIATGEKVGKSTMDLGKAPGGQQQFVDKSAKALGIKTV